MLYNHLYHIIGLCQTNFFSCPPCWCRIYSALRWIPDFWAGRERLSGAPAIYGTTTGTEYVGCAVRINRSGLKFRRKKGEWWTWLRIAISVWALRNSDPISQLHRKRTSSGTRTWPWMKRLHADWIGCAVKMASFQLVDWAVVTVAGIISLRTLQRPTSWRNMSSGNCRQSR